MMITTMTMTTMMTMTRMTMTKRAARPTQQTGSLKALLLTGGVLATLAGARLLNLADIAAAETAVFPATTNPVTVVVPADESITVPLPPNMRGAQIELAPIPQVVQPQIQPVTRTRSSR